jgi:hypothetical protein
MSALKPMALKHRIFDILRALGNGEDETALAVGQIIAGAVHAQLAGDHDREWMCDRAIADAIKRATPS